MTQSSSALIVQPQHSPELVSRARALLANARSLDEVLHVRGIAGAAEKFFKAANHSRHIAKEAAEIRLRAERKAGEILIAMEKTGERADRHGSNKKVSHVVTPTLPDLGVERMQASRWQQIAAIPEKKFEQYIEERKSRPLDELTTSGLMNEVKFAQKHALAEQIRNEPQPLPDGPFRVIVADPPWPYASRADDGTHRARNPYPDMTLDDIRAMPVAARAAENCILWLWTTNAFMRDAFTVLDAWGFEHRTTLTWGKNRIGLGDWLRGQTEHVLFATRGTPVVTLTNQSTLLIADASKHSAKPDEFYAMVDTLCPGSKLEMFAREKRDGWTAWGAEVGGAA